MKQFRNWVPLLGILALVLLFLKLPEMPNPFGIFGCKTCGSTSPYLPLSGSAYFAILVAAALLFPSFPGPQMARGGMLWAVLLAIALTYLNLPNWCVACLIVHAANIFIWMIWLLVPPPANESFSTPIRERLCVLLLVPISLVALFSCLNLTLMIYNAKNRSPVAATSLQTGDAAPIVAAKVLLGDLDPSQSQGMIMNFVASGCPYCKEQLPIVNAVAAQMKNSRYRFINVSPELPPEFVQLASATEWVEDKEGKLRTLFKVAGYPTMFILGTDGKIGEIIAGVPDQLETYLLTNLPTHLRQPN